VPRWPACSADHHHGGSETAIYVVSGHPEVIARTTQEAIVVNLPGLDAWHQDL
jgi:uncharacterized RmlC-like cupin family protein